jgi:hypothetical protein
MSPHAAVSLVRSFYSVDDGDATPDTVLRRARRMAARSSFVDSLTERGGDMSRGPMVRAMVVCGLSVLLTAGCGATIPTDPDGTLDRARGGTLRVGATANGPWVELREGRTPPAGNRIS